MHILAVNSACKLLPCVQSVSWFSDNLFKMKRAVYTNTYVTQDHVGKWCPPIKPGKHHYAFLSVAVMEQTNHSLLECLS